MTTTSESDRVQYLSLRTGGIVTRKILMSSIFETAGRSEEVK